ncbi:hypothetical protein FJ417_28745 [Mesorhizobium sp. B3-1-7]|uniref:hypothetical protein n=1 Tax=Mesorhizobium sp. B3-1-7 TaxID=2589894 RepID=UPI00112935BB|nr:hypothetical protein [Mesorhizobium sp. B3-1-7]TPI51154.1 hypothetical protein FJ417_28745 [Mesorhizobium sp. B3-1-7]
MSILDAAIGYIKSLKDGAEKQRLAEIRIALKHLYFSNDTISRLESIPSIEEFDALNYAAGRASTRQRDTRDSVYKAFSILEAFGTQKGISITGRRLVDQIINTKFGIRHEIEATYFNAIKNGDRAETAELVAKIKKLNKLIEGLDQQLGGIIL